MKKTINSCSNFRPLENQVISSYMNGMEYIVNKPPQCKNCAYYTSSNCGSIFPTDHVEREFFC